MKKILLTILLFICGCSSTYRPSIIDIRTGPPNIDCASPSQPKQIQKIIMEFKL